MIEAQEVFPVVQRLAQRPLILAAIALALSLAWSPHRATAQTATVARYAGGGLLEFALAYFGRAQGASLLRLGGEAGAARLERSILSEGGKPLLARTTFLVRGAGPSALEILERAPLPGRLAKALAELSDEEAGAALRALGRSAGARQLAVTTLETGKSVLRLEARHPGLGVSVATRLGPEGAEAVAALPRREAMVIARRAPEIATLPTEERKTMISLIAEKGASLADWLEKHPGIVVTAPLATFLFSNADRVFGGDEIVLDATGAPHLLSRMGLLERLVVGSFGALASAFAFPAACLLCGMWLITSFPRLIKMASEPSKRSSERVATSEAVIWPTWDTTYEKPSGDGSIATRCSSGQLKAAPQPWPAPPQQSHSPASAVSPPQNHHTSQSRS